MKVLGRIARAAALVVAAVPSAAMAADYCVGVERPDCAPHQTLDGAVTTAQASEGLDRVFLGPGAHVVPARVDTADEPIELRGSGASVTELRPEALSEATLTLVARGSWVSGVAIAAPAAPALVTLDLAGIAKDVTLTARDADGARAAEVRADGLLIGAAVTGPVRATAPSRVERAVVRSDRGPALAALAGTGEVVLDSVDLVAADASAPAVSATCTALVARHVTLTGTASAGIAGACPEGAATVKVAYSILRGSFEPFARSGQTAITSVRSAHAADADVPQPTDPLGDADPRFVSSTDRRLAADSPFVDAGGALELKEGQWDAAALPRAADGDGDGQPERDAGAYERPTLAAPVASGNVLTNPGAEAGVAIDTTADGPEPPGWTRTGTWTTVAYGTSTRTAGGLLVELPTRPAADALLAGGAFFAAGTAASGSLLQRIDVQASAREIDTGGASAALSGLLGGYGLDADRVVLEAVFRDPAGAEIGRLTAPGVTPAQRGNATTLLPRSAAGAIPARTRAIDVTVSAERLGGSYTDAYADELALVLSVPGVPVAGPVRPSDPPVQGLRPFAGIAVLTGRPRVSTKRKSRLRLACASNTVGRCSGTLELRGQLRRGTEPVRIARFGRFSLAPGRQASVTLQVTLAAWRALRGRKSTRATLYAVVRDGQGLERRLTVPLRLRLPKARR